MIALLATEPLVELGSFWWWANVVGVFVGLAVCVWLIFLGRDR